ncbi:chaperone protein ClpB1 [Tanacetum coccineum]
MVVMWEILMNFEKVANSMSSDIVFVTGARQERRRKSFGSLLVFQSGYLVDWRHLDCYNSKFSCNHLNRTEKDCHMVVQVELELNGYFKRIYVTETSQEDSIDILVKLYNVEIPKHILKYTVKVSHQYTPGQLPLKPINLLDRTCAMVRQEFSGEVDEVARLRIDIIGLENELASLEDLEETRRPEVKCFKFIISMKKTELDLLQKNCKQEKHKISDIHAMKHPKRISDQLDTHNMDPANKAKRAKILEGYAAKIQKVESELCGVAKLTLTVGEEHVASS